MLGGLRRVFSAKSVAGAYAPVPVRMSGEPVAGVKSLGGFVKSVVAATGVDAL